MNKIKLHKSEGYAKFNSKRQGLFITHKKGVYKKDDETEILYHKCRLTQVYFLKRSLPLFIFFLKYFLLTFTYFFLHFYSP